MLRYAWSQMEAYLHPLDWNSKFESFCIHARLLHSFLCSSDDNRNHRASDYVGDDFEATYDKIHSLQLGHLVQRLDSQVLHLGKQRSDSERKLTVDKIRPLFDWIETNFACFIKALPEPYKTSWNPDHADPAKTQIGVEKAPTQSSNPSYTLLTLPRQSDTTSMQSITVFNYTTKSQKNNATE
ncbi:MAG TPA: hypothetical protein VGN55_26365 [Xanthobacteraceae bacterium]